MSQYHGFNCGHFQKICHQISRLYRYLSSSFSSCQVDTYFSHSICRWHECEESGVTCFSAWVWRRAFTAQESRILTSHSAFSLGFWFIKGWKGGTICFFLQNGYGMLWKAPSVGWDVFATASVGCVDRFVLVGSHTGAAGVNFSLPIHWVHGDTFHTTGGWVKSFWGTVIFLFVPHSSFSF